MHVHAQKKVPLVVPSKTHALFFIKTYVSYVSLYTYINFLYILSILINIKKDTSWLHRYIVNLFFFKKKMKSRFRYFLTIFTIFCSKMPIFYSKIPVFCYFSHCCIFFIFLFFFLFKSFSTMYTMYLKCCKNLQFL